MVHLLYPRLRTAVAKRLFEEVSAQPVAEAPRDAVLDLSLAEFAPHGGSRADPSHLDSVRRALRGTARELGFPGSSVRAASREFDLRIAKLLHAALRITPHEAASPGVWQFMACVAAPEIVRWRFFVSGGPTSWERYKGGVRNCFGRLWWRAHLLFDATRSNPYEWLEGLQEDESVQIFERPRFAGLPALTRTVGIVFVTNVLPRFGDQRRNDLFREAMLRLMRLRAFVAFEFLDEDVVRALVTRAFDDAAAALGSARPTASSLNTPVLPAVRVVPSVLRPVSTEAPVDHRAAPPRQDRPQVTPGDIRGTLARLEALVAWRDFDQRVGRDRRPQLTLMHTRLKAGKDLLSDQRRALERDLARAWTGGFRPT